MVALDNTTKTGNTGEQSNESPKKSPTIRTSTFAQSCHEASPSRKTEESKHKYTACYSVNQKIIFLELKIGLFVKFVIPKEHSIHTVCNS